MEMNIPKRASRFLAGTGRAVLPKKLLYESARDLHRLQIAMRQGFSTWEEYCEARQRETESFYANVLGCKEEK